MKSTCPEVACCVSFAHPWIIYAYVCRCARGGLSTMHWCHFAWPLWLAFGLGPLSLDLDSIPAKHVDPISTYIFGKIRLLAINKFLKQLLRSLFFKGLVSFLLVGWRHLVHPQSFIELCVGTWLMGIELLRAATKVRGFPCLLHGRRVVM